MSKWAITPWRQSVALLAEGVDRNLTVMSPGTMPSVALLAEGVDRNIKRLRKAVKEPLVALLAEGVDRNGSRNGCHREERKGRPPRGGRG